METIKVKPKTSKAKNRLANVMKKDPICTIEQTVGDKMFVVSSNRDYCFWANKFNDPNWEFEEVTCAS